MCVCVCVCVCVRACSFRRLEIALMATAVTASDPDDIASYVPLPKVCMHTHSSYLCCFSWKQLRNRSFACHIVPMFCFIFEYVHTYPCILRTIATYVPLPTVYMYTHMRNVSSAFHIVHMSCVIFKYVHTHPCTLMPSLLVPHALGSNYIFDFLIFLVSLYAEYGRKFE